ncbi:hypothetical protein C0Z20_09530 [Trinickia symbiotica]|uniref:Uncharacterized protein n=1 Tax=Trinickia symbiotica TaxID=863227 RepID=A0A2N7X5C8_9BURK|nr:hypothetical protein C0Z20_09530 [Trinickia symbiotica]
MCKARANREWARVARTDLAYGGGAVSGLRAMMVHGAPAYVSWRCVVRCGDASMRSNGESNDRPSAAALTPQRN